MKHTIASLLLGALATVASAQAPEAKPTPAAPAIVSSISVEETLIFWGKTNTDTIVELDSTVKGKLYELLGWHVTVPVYSQDYTGYGAIDVGLDVAIVRNEKFLGADTNFTLEGGAWLPTGSAGFGTDNVNPHFGFNYDLTWGSLVYTQTFDVRWVGSFAYSPLFGSFTNYGINAESFVAYKFDTLAVGVDLNQWYTDGSNVAFLGPKAQWTVANSVDLNAGFGVPVWQEVAPANENSWAVTAGLSIKF
jgi:hypothetical protein